jgi:hypothetical protein
MEGVTRVKPSLGCGSRLGFEGCGGGSCRVKG